MVVPNFPGIDRVFEGVNPNFLNLLTSGNVKKSAFGIGEFHKQLHALSGGNLTLKFANGVHPDISLFLQAARVLGAPNNPHIGEAFLELAVTGRQICSGCLRNIPQVASALGFRNVEVFDLSRSLLGAPRVLLQGEHLLGPGGRTLGEILKPF